jgi:glycosyltransferase involved in cell wall biosynthesis
MKSPVTIVFCITELDPGGAERALYNIVIRLDKSSFKPIVISLSGSGIVGEWLRQAGIEVIELKANGKLNPFTLFRLRSELNRLKPTIIQGFLFQANIMSRLAAGWCRVPICLSGIRVAERRSQLYHWIDYLTEFLVTKHVCVSEGVKQFVREQAHLDPQKLVVIPNGVEVEQFALAEPYSRSKLNLQVDDLVAISVGRLDVQKGYDFLLSTLANWKNRPANFKLLIAGQGPEQNKLKSQIKELKLEATVQLLGYREDLPALLKMSDLYLQTSRYEGMCNAILEALAAGKPVITSAVEGVSEIITLEGVYPPFPIGDEAGFIRLLNQFLLEKSHPENVKKRLYVSTVIDFTLDRVVVKYEELYQSLIAEQTN